MFQNKPGQSRNKKLFYLFALVLLFLAASCSSGVLAEEARVRVLHLAPEAGEVEVWVEGQLIDEGLEYRQDTGYLKLPAGENRIVCKTVRDEGSIILNSLFPFRADKDYTISLTGHQGSDLQLMTSIDSCPPNESLSQLKFTDAIPNSPAIDVSIKYGPTLYEGMSFRTSGGCQLIPSDDYVFRFTESRTGRLIAEKEITLKEGTRHNLFATDGSEGSSLDVLEFEKDNRPEREPRVLGVERSVLQLLGAGLIASVLILVLGR